ncbi:MAG: CRISPR-associated protein Cas4 [Planctomycetota bacterium]|nr:CRISPR-associated protein Cas4 [Planctomycetota bacterium]
MEVDDYLPISGLQHLLFCERQCALIHVEQAWSENHLTVEGKHLHEKVDKPGSQERKGVRVARRLPLRSDRLKLTGFADVVEFHAAEDGEVPFPVEYKRGRRKEWRHDEVQLCAQAMCLEEMFEVPVPRGALFYGASRRRLDVTLDDELRAITEAAVVRFHQLVRDGFTPPPVLLPKCQSCSLRSTCMPELNNAPDAEVYLKRLAAGESGRE